MLDGNSKEKPAVRENSCTAGLKREVFVDEVFVDEVFVDGKTYAAVILLRLVFADFSGTPAIHMASSTESIVTWELSSCGFGNSKITMANQRHQLINQLRLIIFPPRQTCRL